MPKLIAFTDLDGTLLDHSTYEYKGAVPALDKMKKRGDALVLASSKTAAEILPLRTELGFSQYPSIIENGAGLLPAGNELPENFENQHGRILDILAGLPQVLRDGFSGFSQWSLEEICERTGLNKAEAYMASKRQFSEPGVWIGRDQLLPEFAAAIAESGLTINKGGRFLTLAFGMNKADRIAEVVALLEDTHSGALTVALGDAPNDIEMLEVVERGFVVGNPAHENELRFKTGKPETIVRSELPGPAGWNQCMLTLIEELEEEN